MTVGMGEVLQKIPCKVALATCTDLEEVCGKTQLCSGSQAGMECVSCLISTVKMLGGCLLMHKMLLTRLIE